MTEPQQDEGPFKAPPHPSEKLTGFTKRVTLSTGVEVVIRKIDVQAYTLDGTQHVLSSTALVEAASQHAQTAANAVKAVSETQPRPPTEIAETLRNQSEIVIELVRRQLKGSLISPKLDELVELYGGSDDLPDMGLGSDYTLLSLAISAFSNADREADQATAEAFPARVGGAAGRPGKAVRQTAK